MFTLEPRATVILAPSLLVNLFSCAMADVSLSTFDQVLSEQIKTLEVVRGMGYLIGLKAEPFNNLEDSCEVAFFLGFWIGVVVAEVALTAVVAGEAEVDGDGFAVADVQVAIWLSAPVYQHY